MVLEIENYLLTTKHKLMKLKLKQYDNEINLFPLSRKDIKEDLLIEEEEWNNLNSKCNEYQEVKLINKELKIVYRKNLEEIKQLKLQELKSNNEQYIYSIYPQYKQNNIAIFGTKEEKENFTNFIKTQVQKYDVLKEEVKNAKSIEDLDKIGI